ncbi:MAG: hypothetical protein GY739_07615 [Mesoflavibacter sp.]|nr:hypothetical protein [Mesoflavibacter sp.]
MSRLITAEEFTKFLESNFNIVIHETVNDYVVKVDFGKRESIEIVTNLNLNRKV